MKMHKMLSLLLALLLVMGVMHFYLPEANAATVTAVEAPMYGRSALAKLPNSKALLYAYDQIAAGVEECAAEIWVYNGKNNISEEELETVLDAYRRDYAHHFWLGNSYGLSKYPQTVATVLPGYIWSGEKLEQMKAEFNAASNEILSGITDSMSDYEKELYIHDALAKRITYIGGTTNAHNAYGALVEGKSVCEGYAEALQYLLQRVGIQSFLVIGYSYNPETEKFEGHEWNVVKIDGKYYHVDLTWDDQGALTYHCYLNVSDTMIKEDHYIEPTAYALPVCNSIDAFYFKQSGAYLDDYDVDQVAELLRKTHGNAHVYIPGDIAEFWNWYLKNIYSIAAKAGVTGEFSVGYWLLGNEMVLTVDVLQEAGHKYDDKVVVTPPTCTSIGYTTYYCVCGAYYIDDEVTERDHSYAYAVVKEPTLTETGTLVGTCPACEDKTDDIELPKLNETDYTYVVTKEPTTKETGSATYTWNKKTYGTIVINVTLDKKPILYGDVNGDGKVNPEDRMILTRYLAHWTGYTADMIDMDAADVNADGKVNNFDRMILTRYLAKWSDYKTLPYLN